MCAIGIGGSEHHQSGFVADQHGSEEIRIETPHIRESVGHRKLGAMPAERDLPN